MRAEPVTEHDVAHRLRAVRAPDVQVRRGYAETSRRCSCQFGSRMRSVEPGRHEVRDVRRLVTVVGDGEVDVDHRLRRQARDARRSDVLEGEDRGRRGRHGCARRAPRRPPATTGRVRRRLIGRTSSGSPTQIDVLACAVQVPRDVLVRRHDRHSRKSSRPTVREMTTGRLRVVQLNAGSLIEPGWDERRHEVVAWLEHLAPDVVCLQEIWEDGEHENTAGWLVEQLASDRWHWVFGGAPFGAALVAGSVAAVRLGDPVPLADRRVDLPPACRSTPSPTPSSATVPWELLHVRTAGLDVFSTHLAAAPRTTDGTGCGRSSPSTTSSGPSRRRRRGRARRAAACGHAGDPRAATSTPSPTATRSASCARSTDARRPRRPSTRTPGESPGEGPGYTQDWRTTRSPPSLNVPPQAHRLRLRRRPLPPRRSAGRVLSAELAFHVR